MNNSGFDFNKEDLKYFEESIFYLIEYFYKNFYIMFKKYCKDVAVQLISNKKIECKQFSNFIKNSIIKEAKIQEKNLQYINNNITNHIFIKNNILGSIDSFCNKYEKDFNENTDFKILNLNSIFYENFYNELLEYCGLKVPNYNKLGFKDITINGIIDKLVSSLHISNETKKRMFKDISQRLSRNKNKKFANNKQLDTKKVGIEKNIKKNPIQKQSIKNNRNINILNRNINNKNINKKQLEPKIKEVEKIKEIKADNINPKTPNSFLSMNDKSIYLKEYIVEKTKNREQLLSNEKKMQNNDIKVTNNNIKFNIFNPLLKFGIGSFMVNNGLKFGVNAVKNFRKIVWNFKRRINNTANKTKILNNLINMNIAKNNTINKRNNIVNRGNNKNNNIIIKIKKEELIRNREKLNNVECARDELSSKMQQKSNSKNINGGRM